MLKVIGHMNPDTDSTCSPIVYAWYLREKYGTDAQAFLSGEPNNEALFVLKKFGIEKPQIISRFDSHDKLIIIDTNNPDELLPGAQDAEIVELIDHHKFAGLKTDAPLKVTMIPLACSATVLWEVMHLDYEPMLSKEMAGLLLSAIISDTLKFSSPTTTERDREVAQKLAKIAKVDIEILAEEMFTAKSDVSALSADDLVTLDSKVFDFSGKKIRISVIETIAPETIFQRKAELQKAIIDHKKSEKLNALLFFVVDVTHQASTLYVFEESEKAIAQKAFGNELTDNEMFLEGVVSRKKQMVPAIEKAMR